MVLKYFTNINDISKDKHEAAQGLDAGRNVGKVTLKCIINAYSPFFTREKVENNLIFNDATLVEVLKYTSDETKQSVTTTFGLEGIHFTPRYVYRANYIFVPREENLTNFTNLNKIGELNNDIDFNSSYKEIVEGKNNVADNTKYKKEQSWIVVASVFDNTLITGIDELIKSQGLKDTESEIEIKNNCTKPIPTWVYSQEKVVTGIRGGDIKLDYKKSFVFSNTTSEIKINKDNINKVDRNSVQMPKQKSAQTCAADGVHWRLLKRTPLFRGEDFFIEFRKKAKASNVTKRGIGLVPFGINLYKPLDVSQEETRQYGDIKKLVPVNLAVIQRHRPAGDNERSNEVYDFSNQAYYIIELGHLSTSENYFIIICERAFPVFIGISGGGLIPDANGRGGISKVYSIFNGQGSIHGKQLIDADNFRITVRNHLGKLAIQFDGTGINVAPWIVEKSDFLLEEEEVPDESSLSEDEEGPEPPPTTGQKVTSTWREEIRRLEVPRGHMLLWGGNILSAFSFGPLQYDQPRLNMVYPPVPIKTEDELNLEPDDNFNFNNTVIDEARLGQSKFTIPQDLSLPLGENHELLLSSTDLGVQDIFNNIKPPTADQNFKSTHIFTQDAQFYSEYPFTAKNGLQDFLYGSFMGGLSLKEVTRNGSLDGQGSFAQAQHSYIATTKFKRAPNAAKRMEVFVMGIAMGVGDHVFHVNGSYVDESQNRVDVTFQFRPGSTKPALMGDSWFLLACKTPILTGIRLKSSENQNPRWETRGLGVDATDHVMHYSESWAASDFFSMEHTGTIKFLLNKDMIIQNDVSGDILSLQNKTFYIDIWAGYECGQDELPYTRMPGLYKMFTGLCHGGTTEEVYGNIVMTCKIHDYTKVLKDTLFFNSPFFDGVKDINAVNELMTMAGFRATPFGRDIRSPVSDLPSFFPPNLLIRAMANNSLNVEQFYLQNVDGRIFINQPYALPSEYNRLSQPAFKFDDGSKFYDAITMLAKRAGKLFYFDQHGIAHYEDFFDIIRQNLLGLTDLPTSFDFTTNPFINPGQLVLNKVDRTLSVDDVHNNIKILSNTPSMTPIWVDQLNWNSFDEPESEGFIGYLKTYFQKEPVFGSLEATQKIADFYRRAMFSPPVQYSFETYGLPVRSLDIVSVDGQSLRVMKVEHTFDPSKNLWWMTLEGERFLPLQ